jgi:AcrR family transcriptional regulator
LISRQTLGISDLVAQSGVPAASVHPYLKLGLLPPPRQPSPNRFVYDERHLVGLKLIRTLRERRHLPLEVIRRILPDLLRLHEEDAFRPEMWDRAVGLRSRRGGQRAPADRLLSAAVEAFSAHSYGEVNVDEICKAARIAKGSFYRHYPSKEDIFFAAADAAAKDVAAAFSVAPAPQLAAEISGDVSSPVGARADGPDRAAEAMARAIEPRLPIFLELLAGAARRRPGYAKEARRIFSVMAEEAGRRMLAREPASVGAAAVERGLALLLRRAVAPTALALEDLPQALRG